MKIKTAVTAIALVGAAMGGIMGSVKSHQSEPISPAPEIQAIVPTPIPAAPTPAVTPKYPQELPPPEVLMVGFGFVIGIILLLLSTSQPEPDRN